MAGSLGAQIRRCVLVACLLAAACVLAAYGPRSDDLPWIAMSRSDWAAQSTEEQISSLAGLLGWLLVAWLVFAASASAAAALPGFAGHAGALMSRRVAPAFVRRLVDAALGLAVVASVAAPTAALADPVVPRRAAIERFVAGTERAPSLLGDRVGAAVDAPAQLGDRVFAVAVALPPVGDAAFDRPAQATPVLHATPRPAAKLSVFIGPNRSQDTGAEHIVVRRGDTLWSIAQRHLGPGATDEQVDAHWRRWYDANRAVIGADPDLISPGARLTPPTPDSP